MIFAWLASALVRAEFAMLEPPLTVTSAEETHGVD